MTLDITSYWLCVTGTCIPSCMFVPYKSYLNIFFLLWFKYILLLFHEPKERDNTKVKVYTDS
jgi:hypothetical protein